MNVFDDLMKRLDGALRLLPDRPEETAASTLRALWFASAGSPQSVERAAEDPLPDLDAAQEETLRALVARRIEGTPLPYLTGRQRFMDLEMFAAPGGLIPRKETEILGWAALDLIRQAAARQGEATVVDACTGSGNLALAYAAHEPRARVLAADLSEDAVAVARQNAQVLALPSRVDFRVGDLLAPFGDEFNRSVDVLSCNPPYISTGRLRAMPADIVSHEPGLAFDGGPFGIRILARLSREGLRLVRPGGWLCFEVGLGQGPPMAQRLAESGAYGEIRRFADAAGEVRALAAQVREG